MQATDIIRAGSDLSLGDGSKILFLKDRWCDGVKLEEMFPFIARIASDSCCVVADVDSPTEGSWCPRLRRNLSEEAISKCSALLENHRTVGSFALEFLF